METFFKIMQFEKKKNHVLEILKDELHVRAE